LSSFPWTKSAFVFPEVSELIDAQESIFVIVVGVPVFYPWFNWIRIGFVIIQRFNECPKDSPFVLIDLAILVGVVF